MHVRTQRSRGTMLTEVALGVSSLPRTWSYLILASSSSPTNRTCSTVGRQRRAPQISSSMTAEILTHPARSPASSVSRESAILFKLYHANHFRDFDVYHWRGDPSTQALFGLKRCFPLITISQETNFRLLYYHDVGVERHSEPFFSLPFVPSWAPLGPTQHSTFPTPTFAMRQCSIRPRPHSVEPSNPYGLLPRPSTCHPLKFSHQDLRPRRAHPHADEEASVH